MYNIQFSFIHYDWYVMSCIVTLPKFLSISFELSVLLLPMLSIKMLIVYDVFVQITKGIAFVSTF